MANFESSGITIVRFQLWSIIDVLHPQTSFLVSNHNYTMMYLLTRPSFTILLLVPLFFPTQGEALEYKVIDLGVAGESDGTWGVDINDKGQIAVQGAAQGVSEGFLWDNGVLTPIKHDYKYFRPAAINNAGSIIGYASEPIDSEGIFWDGNVSLNVGHVLGGQDLTRPEGINDNGLVVGWSLGDPNNRSTVFTWKDGVFHDMGIIDVGMPLADIASLAMDVNNAGVIIGFTRGYDLFSGQSIARSWILGGETTVIPSPFGDENAYFISTAINEHGDVLGHSRLSTAQSVPTIWSDGAFIELLPLAGSLRAGANDFNDEGIGVGASFYPSDDPELLTYGVATVWDVEGQPLDLNENLDASGAGWHLNSGYAINNHGWIVGSGTNPMGEARGFLLIPVPELNSMSLMILGLCFWGIACRT